MKFVETVKSKWNNLSTEKKIFTIILVGVLIRLFLMPFFAHGDILSTYKRAYKIAFEKDNPIKYSQMFSHLVEALNLRLYDLLFNQKNLLPWSLTRSTNEWVNVNLFFFKLPYLLFDLLSVYSLTKLLKGDKLKIKAIAFYFLNPLLIFSTYIFGRFETIPISLTLLSLFLLKSKKDTLSALSLGIAVLSRTSFLILIPLFSAIIGKSWLKKIKLSILSILPYATVLIIKTTILESTSEASWLVKGQHSNFIFGNKLGVSYGGILYLFVIAYIICLYYAFISWIETRNSYKLFIKYGLFVLGAFFILTYFHPQYIAWIVPFITLNLSNKNFVRITIATILISLIYPLFLLTWGPAIMLGVATPLSNTIGAIDIAKLIKESYQPLKLANIAKSAISGLLSAIIYEANNGD